MRTKVLYLVSIFKLVLWFFCLFVPSVYSMHPWNEDGDFDSGNEVEMAGGGCINFNNGVVAQPENDDPKDWIKHQYGADDFISGLRMQKALSQFNKISSDGKTFMATMIMKTLMVNQRRQKKDKRLQPVLEGGAVKEVSDMELFKKYHPYMFQLSGGQQDLLIFYLKHYLTGFRSAVLEEVVKDKKVSAELFQRLLNSNVLRFIVAVEKKKKYKRLLVYFLHQRQEALDFFEELSASVKDKENPALMNGGAKVFVHALDWYADVVDELVINMMELVLKSSEMRRMWDFMPAFFVTLPMLIINDGNLKYALFDIDDKNKGVLEGEGKRQEKCSRVLQELPSKHYYVVFSTFRNMMERYISDHLSMVTVNADFLVILMHRLMNQSNLTRELYGYSPINYKSKELAERTRWLGDLHNFVVDGVDRFEHMQGRQFLYAFLFLMEEPDYIPYMHKKINQFGPGEDNGEDIDHVQSKKFDEARKATIVALANSVHPLNKVNNDQYVRLPGREKLLWKRLYITLYHAHMRILEGKHPHLIAENPGWFEEFLEDNIYLGDFGDEETRKLHEIAAVIKNRVKEKTGFFWGKPQTDEQWEVFYRVIYQYMVLEDEPDLVADQRELLAQESVLALLGSEESNAMELVSSDQDITSEMKKLVVDVEEQNESHVDSVKEASPVTENTGLSVVSVQELNSKATQLNDNQRSRLKSERKQLAQTESEVVDKSKNSEVRVEEDGFANSKIDNIRVENTQYERKSRKPTASRVADQLKTEEVRGKENRTAKSKIGNAQHEKKARKPAARKIAGPTAQKKVPENNGMFRTLTSWFSRN